MVPANSNVQDEMGVESPSILTRDDRTINIISVCSVVHIFAKTLSINIQAEVLQNWPNYWENVANKYKSDRNSSPAVSCANCLRHHCKGMSFSELSVPCGCC